MKKQIVLLAFCMMGAFSLHAQEKNESPAQTEQEAKAKPRKSTDWSKQPIGYLYGGVGVGYIVSTEESEEGSDLSTGFEWRTGISRFYKRWGWGVMAQQFRVKQTVAFSEQGVTLEAEDVGRLLYVAPQFTGRWVLGKKLNIYGAVGWGWLRYKETLNLDGFGKIEAKANALGGNFNVGLEYRLTPVIGLSVDAGLVGGEIGKPKTDNAVIQAEIDRIYEGKMDASRLYATVGVHINFWKKKK